MRGPPSTKRPRRSQKQRRFCELERSAAERHLNGNGMSGSLPPLPATSLPDYDDDDCGVHYEEKRDPGIDTLFGHPYGALPFGNIHLASLPTSNDATEEFHPDHVRHAGLGKLLRRLNDEQLLAVLSFVDGQSLARGVVTCSRFLYVAGHHDELWRDLTLRQWGEVGFEVFEPIQSPMSSMRTSIHCCHNGCWKDIYSFNYNKNRIQQQSQATQPPKRHRPINVQGIYSDTFFRSWLCRSFALQPSWLSTHTVPTILHGDLTTDKFFSQYEETNTPLLIKGASTTWPALQKWNIEYLLHVTEGKSFRATSGAAPLPAQFNLKDYFNYCSCTTEEAPLYLFDRTFASKCPQLLQDFDEALKVSCPFWNRDSEHGHDLFGVLGEMRRPDYQWLIIGPKRSGSCFHIDPNCTHAWNAPIIGRKRWIFYPPGATPPGVFPSPTGDDVCMPISLGEWFLTFWDEHVERRKEPDLNKRPLECTACPGDVLFVPHGWWHMVLNIGDNDAEELEDCGVSVALTRNYVSASNLSDVLRFLDTKIGQISGCRDRDEAIQPEDIGREFRKALLEVKQGDQVDHQSVSMNKMKSEERKDVSKWAALLEKAEGNSRKGWTCAAWTDISEKNDSSVIKRDYVTYEKKILSDHSIVERAKRAINESENYVRSTACSSNFSFSFL